MYTRDNITDKLELPYALCPYLQQMFEFAQTAPPRTAAQPRKGGSLDTVLLRSGAEPLHTTHEQRRHAGLIYLAMSQHSRLSHPVM